METALSLETAKILTSAAKKKASIIHLVVGNAPILRLDSGLVELADQKIVTREYVEEFVLSLLTDDQKEVLKKERALSLVYFFENKIRFKLNAFYQKNTLTASLKLIPLKVPTIAELDLPTVAKKWAELERGLVIIGGTFNSGRSTTVAALIEEINRTKSKNIVTIEKPIEYLFFNNRSIIEQREVGRDALSFTDALNYSRQEDVEVIVVGENNEPDAIFLALEMANAGKLVFLLIDTITTIQTIKKILAFVKPAQRELAKSYLVHSLAAIMCQRLLPKIGGGLVLAAEILVGSPSVLSLIRDDKSDQISSLLQASREEGMVSLDQSLAELVESGQVALEVALEEVIDKNNFRNATRR